MTQQEQLKQIIEDAWENRDSFTAADASPILRAAIAEVIRQLDCGQLRVAEKQNGEWIVNQWTKKAVLLSFRLQENVVMPVGSDGSPALHFYDKVSSKFANYSQEDFARGGYRVVPPAVARLGSYIGHGIGEVMVGFSTANRIPAQGDCLNFRCIHESHIDDAFRAVAEATEEAVLRSMLEAHPVTGYTGKLRRSLSEFWQP